MPESTWSQYRRTTVSEMRPYVEGESLEGVSVTDGVSPVAGGMVARDPQNHDDQWYIEPAYFAANFAPTGIDNPFNPGQVLQIHDEGPNLFVMGPIEHGCLFMAAPIGDDGRLGLNGHYHLQSLGDYTVE